jgi:hypothetical protein
MKRQLQRNLAAAVLFGIWTAPGPAQEPPAATPPAPSQGTTADADLSARFRCPESYATDQERSSAWQELWRTMAERHPGLTREQALEAWNDLLRTHACTAVIEDSIVVTGGLPSEPAPVIFDRGATVHTLSSEQIELLPQGEDAPFQQVLLRIPGVVQDSFGEVHVRGEHGNLQYRINGILLPESLNGFAQQVDTRFIASVTLSDGSLPAEFGFRNSAVVDLTAKRGDQLHGGEVSLSGGTYSTLQPSMQYGNSAGPFEYYAAGSYKQTGLGVENPSSSSRPLHDDSSQERGFSFLAYQIAPSRRLSLIASASLAAFEIPTVPGLRPSFVVAGAEGQDSARLTDSQRERNGYVVLADQEIHGNLQFEAAAFGRYGNVAFSPDTTGDLVFSGVASRVDQNFLSQGLQLDASYASSDPHKVGAGVLLTREKADRSTDSAVFPTDVAGQQASAVPLHIFDAGTLYGVLTGIYLQDEWRPLGHLTVSYGLRYDRSDAFLRESQLSPRLSCVWAAGDRSTFHLGYARYFTPPSLQFIPPDSVALFRGTTNAPETLADSPPRAERADTFDLGLSRQMLPGWQVALDGFFKQATNLIDLGQFGRALLLAPFNYRKARVDGAEISTTVRAGGFAAYGNAAYVFTQAREITSAQFEFPLAELEYIRQHYIRLDHEGEISGSAGAAYTWRTTRAFVDLLYCSGLRRGFANLDKLPAYEVVNLGIEETLPMPGAGVALKLRLEVANLFDQIYPLRDGTGIGIAASQYGPRRSLFSGLALLF